VTDSKGLSTFVFAGAMPAGSSVDTKRGEQLQGWLTKAEVQHVLLMLNRSPDVPDIWLSPKHTRSVRPFAVLRGECVYEKSGDLCFYAGARDKKAGNLMMILSRFPSALAPRRYGKGVLKMSGGRGGLTKGNLTWDLVEVNNDGNERLGNWDTIVSKALGAAVKGMF